jgi:hypothetical protein
MSLSDNIQGTPLCFVVDVGDVERKEAKGDEHDADEKEGDIGQNSRTGEAKSPGVEVAVDEHDGSQEACSKRDHYRKLA